MSQQWDLQALTATLEKSRRYHWLVLALLTAVAAALLLWASLAQLDEITRGAGRVIPSKQLQVVQSVDGGVVKAVHVQEGQLVESGQPLLRIDDIRFRADFQQSEQEILGLDAAITRLKAELASVLVLDDEGRWQVRLHLDRLHFPESLEQAQPELAQRQRSQYLGRLNNLGNQLAILAEQVQQKKQELRQLDSRLRHQRDSLALARQELALTEPLAEQGAVSEVELLRLRRQVNDLKGQLALSRANRPRIEAAGREAQFKRRDVALAFRAQAQAELSRLEQQSAALSEGASGLEDRLKHAELLSPVKGKIKKLHITTLGAVVKSGTPVVEIVPVEDQLLVEARVRPGDIAFLRPGLPAVVRFSAYDFTIYGGLDGVLEHVSADSIEDEEGEQYYLVRVRTRTPFLERGQQQLPIMPGMLTQVDMITGRKSVLDHLISPFKRARERALRER